MTMIANRPARTRRIPGKVEMRARVWFAIAANIGLWVAIFLTGRGCMG